MDTMAGREQWISTEGLPRQLPPDVVWTQALPAVLSWLSSTQNVEPRMVEMRKRRFSARFPGFVSDS
jgi:hypothetical protein